MCCPLSVHINPSGLAGHSLKRRCHLGGRAAKADLSGHFSSPGALSEEALTCWGELRVQVRLCVPGAWGGAMQKRGASENPVVSWESVQCGRGLFPYGVLWRDVCAPA